MWATSPGQDLAEKLWLLLSWKLVIDCYIAACVRTTSASPGSLPTPMKSYTVKILQNCECQILHLGLAQQTKRGVCQICPQLFCTGCPKNSIGFLWQDPLTRMGSILAKKAPQTKFVQSGLDNAHTRTPRMTALCSKFNSDTTEDFTTRQCTCDLHRVSGITIQYWIKAMWHNFTTRLLNFSPIGKENYTSCLFHLSLSLVSKFHHLFSGGFYTSDSILREHLYAADAPKAQTASTWWWPTTEKPFSSLCQMKLDLWRVFPLPPLSPSVSALINIVHWRKKEV